VIVRQYGSGWIIAELLGALLGTYLFTWLRAGAEVGISVENRGKWRDLSDLSSQNDGFIHVEPTKW